MNVSDIATELFIELEEPSDISVGAISTWLSANIGKFIGGLDTNFSLSNDGEVSPVLSNEEKAIFKLFYLVHYYGRQLRKNLCAASYDSSIVEITEGNRTVRKVSKNEVAKTWRTVVKDTQAELDDMILGYKIGASMPKQINADTFGNKGTTINGVPTSVRVLWDS